MFQSLQSGRAVAAVLVLLFHLGQVMSFGKYFDIHAFRVPFHFGHSGVHFFFVLSGFIIFFVHRHDLGRPERLGSYLKKRATRIYPIYWIIFLGVYGLAMASGSLRSTVPHDPILILKSLLLVPLDPAVVHPPADGGPGAVVLIVAWSLQFEVLFYLAFAAAIFRRWLGWVALLGVLAVYLIPLGVPFPWSLMHSRFPLLFLLGIAVAFLVRFDAGSRWPKMAVYLGIAAYIIMGISEDILQFSGMVVDYGYGLLSALIVWGLVKSEESGKVFGGHPWLQLLGAASYVLYLVHLPLVSILCKAAMAIGAHGSVAAVITYVVIVATCILVAIGIHWFVERPILRALRPGRPVGAKNPYPA